MRRADRLFDIVQALRVAAKPMTAATLAGQLTRPDGWCRGNHEKGEATMSPDLKILVWTAVLAFAQSIIAALGAQLQIGVVPLAGNRENLPPVTGWAGRASRAHRNILESLPVFAVLVLVAQISGRANATTALGAELFFWARLIYVPVYTIGVPWLRSAVWIVSAAGMATILAQLL